MVPRNMRGKNILKTQKKTLFSIIVLTEKAILTDEKRLLTHHNIQLNQTLTDTMRTRHTY